MPTTTPSAAAEMRWPHTCNAQVVLLIQAPGMWQSPGGQPCFSMKCWAARALAELIHLAHGQP